MRNAFAQEGADIADAIEPVLIRKAEMHDIHPILRIVNEYAALGIMLPRTEFEMSENIRDFSVACIGERVAGCGALHFYTPVTAEVRSLAVDPVFKSRGIGRILVEALEAEARQFGLHSIFAFTYVDKFFERLGFIPVERGELPLKVWKDCVRCPKFDCCDEIAVLKYLIPNPTRLQPVPAVDFGEIRLPILRH